MGDHCINTSDTCGTKSARKDTASEMKRGGGAESLGKSGHNQVNVNSDGNTLQHTTQSALRRTETGECVCSCVWVVHSDTLHCSLTTVHQLKTLSASKWQNCDKRQRCKYVVSTLHQQVADVCGFNLSRDILRLWSRTGAKPTSVQGTRRWLQWEERENKMPKKKVLRFQVLAHSESKEDMNPLTMTASRPVS